MTTKNLNYHNTFATDKLESSCNIVLDIIGSLQQAELDGIVDIWNFRFQRIYKPHWRLNIYLV